MRTVRLRFLAVLVTMALVASLGAQEPPRDGRVMATTGTASVIGTVVSIDDPHRPIRNATVTISTRYNEIKRIAVSDDDGRFVVDGLPAGQFFVGVEKAGYLVSDSAGKAFLKDLPVVLVDGERQTLTIQMMRGAAIAGRVLDAYGRPQPDVRVSAIKMRFSRGRRVRDLVPLSGTAFSLTDAAGAFRFYGLTPGDYVVSTAAVERPDLRPVTQAEIVWAQQLAQGGAPSTSAAVPAPEIGRPLTSPAAYYPGVTDMSAATVVTVSAGEERDGLDFSLPSVPTSKIEGTVVDASGRQISGIEVSLLSAESASRPLTFGIPASRTDRAGAFHFFGLIPGPYTLIALPQSSAAADSPARSSSWAREAVSVNGNDLTDVVLRLQPSSSVSGRIVLESSTQTDISRTSLYLSPVSGAVRAATGPVRPASDGSFVFRDLLPDRYSLTGSTQTASPAAPAGAVAMFSLPTSWLTKSVIVNGVETIETGIDVSAGDVGNVVVTLTDRRAQISGTLRDAANRPVSQTQVVAFGVDEQSWKDPLRRVFWIATDDQGVFTITVGRPGEYYLVGRKDLDPQDFLDPSFVGSLVASAIKITVADGEKKTQDLKLSGGG